MATLRSRKRLGDQDDKKSASARPAGNGRQGRQKRKTLIIKLKASKTELLKLREDGKNVEKENFIIKLKVPEKPSQIQRDVPTKEVSEPDREHPSLSRTVSSDQFPADYELDKLMTEKQGLVEALEDKSAIIVMKDWSIGSMKQEANRYKQRQETMESKVQRLEDALALERQRNALLHDEHMKLLDKINEQKSIIAQQNNKYLDQEAFLREEEANYVALNSRLKAVGVTLEEKCRRNLDLMRENDKLRDDKNSLLARLQTKDSQIADMVHDGKDWNLDRQRLLAQLGNNNTRMEILSRESSDLRTTIQQLQIILRNKIVEMDNLGKR